MGGHLVRKLSNQIFQLLELLHARLHPLQFTAFKDRERRNARDLKHLSKLLIFINIDLDDPHTITKARLELR